MRECRAADDMKLSGAAFLNPTTPRCGPGRRNQRYLPLVAANNQKGEASTCLKAKARTQ
jgi:hypothetical protein